MAVLVQQGEQVAAQRGSENDLSFPRNGVPGDMALNSRNPRSRREAATKEESELRVRAEESISLVLQT